MGKRFGNEWVVAIRLHPRAKSCAEEIIPQANYIFDATNYPDIQELLSAADAVITDYSSCVFDFMLSQKPAFIYAPDMESYDTERGFYYPLAATPFPIAVNNTQLNENILNFDYDKYVQRVKDFTKEKGCIEDGKASQRVVELIKSKMAG